MTEEFGPRHLSMLFVKKNHMIMPTTLTRSNKSKMILMNYQKMLNKFEEEEKRKTLHISLDGQSIFISSYFCKMKFVLNYSILLWIL